ncbi:MAG TPA: PSD1 and planctomycete cytochrome C domain-containing protein [Gemmataceae bacterium]|nr:PSD1 and planctomycete cytochrome C domain-containing protein [Gemmataceae bacterium]
MRNKETGRCLPRQGLLSACWVALFAAGAHAAPPAPLPPDHAARMARGRDLFARHVRPLLTEHCVKCHGGDKTRSGLDLSTREALLKGGDNGPAVVPNDAKASRLYMLAGHLDKPHMPPKGAKLSAEQLARLAAWIDLGAPYDRPLVERAGPAGKKPMRVTEEDRLFWSFRPLARPTPPAVKSPAWCRTPVDQFILHKLEDKGLTPTAEAERRKLIRRAYFDLIGLPPSPAEVEAFVRDPSPRAYEALIDRLLASPHFGERWARHWLDVARFAESHGFEHDYDRPTAYHYRDFVIKALNQDLPYDRFVQWQLAGDELAPDDPLALTATGFLAAGVHSTQITISQVEKERYDELDDIVRTTGTAFLGLTVGCARCHDHKYDPIPTRDYYRLLSTFTTTVRTEVEVDFDPAATHRARAQFDAEHDRLVAARRQYEQTQLPGKLDAWLAAKPRPAVTPAPPEKVRRVLDTKPSDADRAALLAWFRTTDKEWQRLNKQVEEHAKARERLVPKALICSEGLKPLRLHSQGADFLQETHFLKRGDPNQKDGVAAPGFLQVLTRAPEGEKHWQAVPPPGWRTSYRRLSLARWLTDVDQGAGHLLARVIVNRLWQHHMGRGIVGTPSDFGLQGERPTHPELLDWLARQLIANGWRLKPIHKLIMTSAAYRQGTAFDPNKSRLDSDNRLLWRRAPRRLEGEVIRDALLAVSGTLDERQFGPGTLDRNHKRRSIYFFVKRSQLVPTMVLFDGPDAHQGIEQRTTTTIAPQALLLMNSALVRGCAEGFARRLAPSAEKGLPDAVRDGYATALGRVPSSKELAAAVGFVQEQMASYRADGKNDARHLALTDFCQVLMDLNEFVYVE